MTWQHEFAQQPFRRKLAWLPKLAGVALLLVVSVNVLFGIINGRRLARIEHGHYPLMQTTRSLEVTLWRLQRELQDAVGASDAARITAADAVSRTLAGELKAIESNATVGEAEVVHLDEEFAAYYALARTTSLTLIADGPSDALLPDLGVMQDRYNHLVESLAAIRARRATPWTKPSTAPPGCRRRDGSSP